MRPYTILCMYLLVHGVPGTRSLNSIRLYIKNDFYNWGNWSWHMSIMFFKSFTSNLFCFGYRNRILVYIIPNIKKKNWRLNLCCLYARKAFNEMLKHFLYAGYTFFRAFITYNFIYDTFLSIKGLTT